jgi:hypothetical protein
VLEVVRLERVERARACRRLGPDRGAAERRLEPRARRLVAGRERREHVGRRRRERRDQRRFRRARERNVEEEERASGGMRCARGVLEDERPVREPGRVELVGDARRERLQVAAGGAEAASASGATPFIRSSATVRATASGNPGRSETGV